MSGDRDDEAAVVRAARALCRYEADVCGTHPDDEWTLYADDFKARARVAIDAYNTEGDGHG